MKMACECIAAFVGRGFMPEDEGCLEQALCDGGDRPVGGEGARVRVVIATNEERLRGRAFCGKPIAERVHELWLTTKARVEEIAKQDEASGLRHGE